MDIAEYQAPFRHWVIDGVIPHEVLFEAWCAIPPVDWPNWVRYDNECERKRTTNDFTGTAIDELFGALNSWTWLAFLERLTGITGLRPDPTLHGAGIHISAEGDFLGPHLDFALHPKLPGMERRLNLITFLTAAKSGNVVDEYGGAFQLYDDEGRDVVKQIPIEFGRVIIWEPTDTAFHGTARANHDRVTAAVYYLCHARPTATRKRALFAPNRGK